MTTTIVNIDDHALFCAGLQSALAQHNTQMQPASYDIVCMTDCQSALTLIEQRGDVDLVLLDLALPDMRGEVFFDVLQARGLDVPVMILSATENLAFIKAALQKGALGYINKAQPVARIIHAIDTALSGAIYLPDDVAQKLNALPIAPFDAVGDVGLTTRERDIAKLLVHGHSNKQIAELLFISPNTVKTHLKSMFAKLSVDNRISCIQKLTQATLT